MCNATINQDLEAVKNMIEMNYFVKGIKWCSLHHQACPLDDLKLIIVMKMLLWIYFCVLRVVSCNLIFFQKLATFHDTFLFLYTLKTSENRRFSDVFRECRKRSMTWNELNQGNSGAQMECSQSSIKIRALWLKIKTLKAVKKHSRDEIFYGTH